MSEPIPPDLLEILVCPETHQRLEPATAGLLGRLQALSGQDQLLNRAGEKVTEAIEGALVREDGKFAYAIVDQIPIMLIDEAIPLDQVGEPPPDAAP